MAQSKKKPAKKSAKRAAQKAVKKASRKPVRKPAAKNLKARRVPAAPELAAPAGWTTVTADAAKEGLECVLGAAYLLMDRAHVLVDGNRAGVLRVSLSAKPGKTGDLAEAFRRELEAQKVRWAIARNNLPVREYLAEQAVLLASGQLPPLEAAPAAPAPAQEQLSDAQRQEIEKLIAEVEEEIRSMNKAPAAADPKGIRASWEEKQEVKAREGGA